MLPEQVAKVVRGLISDAAPGATVARAVRTRKAKFDMPAFLVDEHAVRQHSGRGKAH